MHVSRNPRSGAPPSGAQTTAGCTGIRCDGASADDVLEDVGEGRREVTPEEALVVGVLGRRRGSPR
eukprot:12692318-Alexandrium_andersonii.AAC.1